MKSAARLRLGQLLRHQRPALSLPAQQLIGRRWLEGEALGEGSLSPAGDIRLISETAAHTACPLRLGAGGLVVLGERKSSSQSEDRLVVERLEVHHLLRYL